MDKILILSVPNARDIITKIAKPKAASQALIDNKNKV